MYSSMIVFMCWYAVGLELTIKFLGVRIEDAPNNKFTMLMVLSACALYAPLLALLSMAVFLFNTRK